MGLDLAAEADTADIQTWADHVLRKESGQSSRYLSLTMEIAVARRFAANDDRHVYKIAAVSLRQLETDRGIRVWHPDDVHEAMLNGPKKMARQANDVWSAMKRNSEILVEGAIPARVVAPLRLQKRRT